jgi:hypothetical protein
MPAIDGARSDDRDDSIPRTAAASAGRPPPRALCLLLVVCHVFHAPAVKPTPPTTGAVGTEQTWTGGGAVMIVEAAD